MAHAVFGTSRGYSTHAQLARFTSRAQISAFLFEIYQKSVKREYHFDKAKIMDRRGAKKISVTRGQYKYELALLSSKIGYEIKKPTAHPLFKIIPGKQTEPWEKVKDIF